MQAHPVFSEVYKERLDQSKCDCSYCLGAKFGNRLLRRIAAGEKGVVTPATMRELRGRHEKAAQEFIEGLVLIKAGALKLEDL